MYPFSPKLPSHPGCHITLSRAPCAVYSRSLLVICFRCSGVYMFIPNSTIPPPNFLNSDLLFHAGRYLLWQFLGDGGEFCLERTPELQMFPSCYIPRKEEPAASCPVFNLGCGRDWVLLMFQDHCQRLPVSDCAHSSRWGEREEVENPQSSPIWVFFLPGAGTALTRSPEGSWHMAIFNLRR